MPYLEELPLMLHLLGCLLSGKRNVLTFVFPFFSLQHNRFVSDSKDKEPDVLFVGDSLVQLMHQFGVKHKTRSYMCLVRMLFLTHCDVLINT